MQIVEIRKSFFYSAGTKYGWRLDGLDQRGVGINKKLMQKGFGGLLSFEVKGGLEAARIVLENLELFWHAPNIGESRSLILCPWVTTHGVMNDEEKLKAGITPGTLRLSMGREDPRDPKIDLNKGLKLI